jgi:anti-sigma factor RsiW
MNATRHLTSDEIVERVFPGDDRPAAVPEHLATCATCQERVATLRDAWLLDRGAVSGAVDDLPSGFWEAQAAAAMAAVRAGVPEEIAAADVRVFPSRVRSILRHPALALSSLAAALLLVAGLSDLRSSSTAPAVQTATLKNGETREKTPAPATDAADDELLVSVDRALEDSLLADFIVEEAS